MKQRSRNRSLLAFVGGVLLTCNGSRCTPSESVDGQLDAAGPVQGPRIDCVGVLQVTDIRGHYLGNARRFGKSDPALRQVARLTELSAADLADFCDWEACVRANGYAHSCHIDDGGVERCRVCDAGDDCEGFFMNREACTSKSHEQDRAQCHAGLLQECLLQQGMRGFADGRLTRTCWLSTEACAGRLPGDQAAAGLAAQHETNQVTVEVCGREVEQTAALQPDSAVTSAVVEQWRAKLSQWDGGPPSDVGDAGSDQSSGDQ